MRHKLDNRDQVVAQIAARQHGVAKLAQLRWAGLSPDAIKRRVAAGRLHRRYRGVYAVGHVGLSIKGEWMAAVFACGDGAVLSHRSAAELWEMLSHQSGPIHVTVPTGAGRTAPEGIVLHRSPSMPSSATTRRDGIPVTKPARTLIDLRRTSEQDDYRRALREAEFRWYDVEAAIKQEDALTRSQLERRFKALCRRHRLPEPEVNAMIGPYEVDFLWRDERLIVETDGYQGHRGRAAFEADREQDAELRARGWTVVRFTDSQVKNRWPWVKKTVRALLDEPRLSP